MLKIQSQNECRCSCVGVSLIKQFEKVQVEWPEGSRIDPETRG
jgi:hypothetical protein